MAGSPVMIGPGNSQAVIFWGSENYRLGLILRFIHKV
jgi:hypothetical protein